MSKMQSLTETKLAKLKDSMLGIMIINKVASIETFVDALKIEEHLAISIIQQFGELGFVSLQDLTAKPDYRNYLISLESKAYFFFHLEGGFIKLHKIERRRHIWIVAKTIAAILNAVIIILIGYWSLNEQRKSNNDREEVNSLKHRIEVLEKVIGPKK
jgi:hypothetical protein